MDKFAVGEVAIGQNFAYWPELNGAECTIVRGLEFGVGIDLRKGVVNEDFRYLVLFADGHLSRVKPANLRKRPSDTDEEAAWTIALDCIDRAKRRAGIAA